MTHTFKLRIAEAIAGGLVALHRRIRRRPTIIMRRGACCPHRLELDERTDRYECAYCDETQPASAGGVCR